MFTALIAASGWLALAGVARAGSHVDVGNHDLLPNQANQVIVLQVTNDAGSTPPQVTDFSGYFQIGPNSLDQAVPQFQGADFTGTFWGANGGPTGGGPETGMAQLMQKGFSLDSGSVAASGNLIRLIVDTTGINSGVYDLKLTNSAYFDFFGQNSSFLPAASNDAIAITNGTITITPEPAGLSVMLLTGGAIAVRRRRRR
jgi:hypothetical protein